MRGAPLATHILNDANPVLTPYCLASVNGQSASYPCPKEGGCKYRRKYFQTFIKPVILYAGLPLHHTQEVVHNKVV